MVLIFKFPLVVFRSIVGNYALFSEGFGVGLASLVGMSLISLLRFVPCAVSVTEFFMMCGPVSDSAAVGMYVLAAPPLRPRVRGSGGVAFYGPARPHT